jgi:hypothetical protein
MAGKIFINYRRDDDAGFTQALYLRLASEFAADDLFMDREGHIKPGDPFVEVLNAQVAACDVLLAVIGPRWAELLAARQGDPEDFVSPSRSRRRSTKASASFRCWSAALLYRASTACRRQSGRSCAATQ